MARKARGPRYYESRGGYFVTYQGTTHRLATGPKDEPNGPTYLEALAAFQDLMRPDSTAQAGDGNTLGDLAEMYALHLEDRGKVSSRRLFVSLLSGLVDLYGTLPVRELKPLHVERWLSSRSGALPGEGGRSRGVWCDATKRTALGKLQRLLRWAQRQGYTRAVGPLDLTEYEGLQRGKRGVEAVIPEADYLQLKGAVAPRWADLLTVLWESGCRPAEALAMDRRYWHPEDGCFIYSGRPAPGHYVWKNARKTGKDRLIFLSPAALDVVERLFLAHPTGPIFRNRMGRPMNPKSTSEVTARLFAQRGMLPYTMYCFRHSYATRFILKGGNIKLLADLLGTSVAEIDRTYAHLSHDKAEMRRLMLKVMAD